MNASVEKDAVTLPENIRDVDEATFESEVLLRSHEVPVIVDFWAPWCGPCRMLGPILERLAIEGGGSFLLAKVNVDESPNLAIRYGVQGIPAVKAFRNGEIVGEFIGAQPEPVVRRLVERLVPSPADTEIQKAKSLLATHHWSEAEAAFSSIYEQGEENAAAALGLVESLLMLGRGAEAQAILEHFPAGNEWALAERLKPLAGLLAEVGDNGPRPENDPLAAELYQAARLIVRGNLPAAMDGLLGILRQDKTYRRGLPKDVLLGLFVILGDEDATVREYRSELASILF
jgi:putative thioredoxin